MLEMWMVLTHLGVSFVTCVACAVFNVHAGAAQTALFGALAVGVSICSFACMQDGAQCAPFFPAAAWPALAAAGALAWAWVLYVASLGCQTGLVSLGFSQEPPWVLLILEPAVRSTLRQTCGVACPSHLPLLGCSLPAQVICLVLTAVLWHAGPAMQAVSAFVLVLDAFLALSSPWLFSALALYAFVSQNPLLSRLLFGPPKRGPQQHLQ
jgi:hypothetical protein